MLRRKVIVAVLTLISSWAACRAGRDDANDTVHIVFSNHLDIGYGGIPPELGVDNVILNKYFQWYFPQAVRLGKWFDLYGGSESHIYSAHAYVASLYLNCPPGMGLACPSERDRDDFREACRKGHITWTALPWNGQAEVMDPLSLGSAVHVTHYLDADVGVPRKTVVSQRDVPGLTRAAIPVLAGEGVRAISVGVNSGSAPPDVPLNRPFVWRDRASGTQLLAFWHPFGYGGHVADPSAPGGSSQLTPAEDCVRTPRPSGGRSRHILCFSWRGDNSGPHPDPDAVLHVFALARRQFPGAKVIASTFEAFVDELAPFAEQLPVVESEIGDTWIYGVPSDPVKSARFRGIQRMRSRCLLEESCTAQDPAFRNFTRLLLKVPEHTWGIDSKAAPADWAHWSNRDMREQLRSNALWRVAVDSWRRQLQYIDWAVEALQYSLVQPHLAGDMRAQLLASEAPHPAIAGQLPPLELAGCARPARIAVPSAGARLSPRWLGRGARGLLLASDPPACQSDALVLDNARWVVRADAETGELLSFVRKWERADGTTEHGTDWAADGMFGRLLYSTYDEDHFRKWDSAYNPGGGANFDRFWKYDFGKPGADAAGVTMRDSHPRLADAYRYDGSAEGEEVLVLRFQFEEDLVRYAGAPANISVLVRTWSGTQSVMVDVYWAGKPATRVPEALWMRFAPGRDSFQPDSMHLWKVGSMVSPLEVVRNGSHSMHAVGDGGVLLQSRINSWETLQIVSMDAPVVAIGAPAVLPDFVGPADVASGVSFCLVNNVWGTNYVMWFPYLEDVGADMKFRFMVTVRDSRQEQRPHWHLSFDPHFSDVPAFMLL